MSPLVIRRTILAELAAAAPYAAPAEGLLNAVNDKVRPKLSLSELRGHLSWLLDHTMVDFLPDDIDPDNVNARRWLIKEAGLAALRR
jgi:hypothetical protein